MAEAAFTPESGSVPRQIVHVVEDDEQFRLSLLDLLQAINIEAKAFSEAATFFRHTPTTSSGCVLLDVRLPGINGIKFQEELETRGYHLPVVFMTAHGDVGMSVLAMKAGAIDFLEKPLRTEELLNAIQTAFALDLRLQKDRAHLTSVQMREASLTRRELQVFERVASGLMNKQIAFELGISEIMVKLHRGKMMRKMDATSLADLVRQFELLNLDRVSVDQ
jgi:FixJ family two-component response regulator